MAVVLLLLVASSATLLWRLGIFDTKTRASNAQILAAAIGLVGVLVTASLTFIGVLLKHSIDGRTLHQTAETEGRLRLETSIRAVELLTEEGQPATPTRQAGALFVLINLNQLDFAYALLGQIWTNREISPGAAVWVINQLLLNGSPSLQQGAAVLLYANADALATESDFEFPDCVTFRWRNDLPTGVREHLVAAILRCLLSKPRDAWDSGVINSVVAQLDLIRRTDDAPHVRGAAVLGLAALFETSAVKDDILLAPDGEIDVDQLKSEITRVQSEVVADVASEHARLAEGLRTNWAIGT
jgi:hypothetical protein